MERSTKDFCSVHTGILYKDRLKDVLGLLSDSGRRVVTAGVQHVIWNCPSSEESPLRVSRGKMDSPPLAPLT